MRTPHYLAPLKTTRVPRHHIVFDCETRSSKRAGKFAHRWECGAATEISRWAEGRWSHGQVDSYTRPRDLWADIVLSHAQGDEMVIWAHNLAFDLRVSEALRILPDYGYQLEAIVLEKTAAWASFKGVLGKLTICDLMSWLPVGLDTLIADMGGAREPFDYDRASTDELAERCKSDVGWTAMAVCHVLDFLEREDAGPFRPTGSGQSHAMWRRRFLEPRSLLIHGDDQALLRERTAMWAGRTESWRWGRVHGPLHEHDLNLAYCRIAATEPVPVKLTGKVGQRSKEWLKSAVRQQAVLAEVTVTVKVPLVPMEVDDRVIWPVGTFRTTLWGPELELLLANNADIEVHRAWLYRQAPILAPMANYLIDLMEMKSDKAAPVVHRLLKHWARTLVGRCALRYRQWEPYGVMGASDLRLTTATATEDEAQVDLLQVGQRIFELADLYEADSSTPQITGWVMSRARCYLWQVIETAGLDNIAYMDTDSVLVNQKGSDNLLHAVLNTRYLRLVHKATYTSAEIVGPRNLTLEGHRRISGIPRRATQTGHLTFDGEIWTGIRASIEGRRASEVGIQQRTFSVDDVDPRRERQSDGTTTPYRMERDATVSTDE